MFPQFDDLIFLLTGRTETFLSEEINVLLICSAVLLTAFFCPRRFFKLRRLSYFRPVENALNRLGRRRGLAIVLVGVLSLALNAGISLFGQMPLPSVHDEFSYLLAADTFAHWRLANPTHPFWVHFESFHIIHQPAYMSKYPPGQGLMLATGQILFGLPIVGSWLGTAVACMAICWALQQWLPARTAFLGGIVTALHPMILSWTQSFWGSQLALAGGALIVGALRFFGTEHRALPKHAGLAFGIGCSLMLITRPYEGTVLTVLSAVYILKVWLSDWPATKDLRKPVLLTRLRTVILILLCFGCTIGFWGYYNYRVTGQPLKMPYMVHHETYGVSPLLIWEKFRPLRTYRHREMRIFHREEEAPTYVYRRTPLSLLQESGIKLNHLLHLYGLSAALAASLIFWPQVYRRNPRFRPLFWIVGGFTFALLLGVWLIPHYATPILATTFVIGWQAWRRLRVWRWHGRPAGLFIARAGVLLCLLSLVSSIAFFIRPDNIGLTFLAPGSRLFSRSRAQVVSKLQQTPGRDLVLVHYSARHLMGNEWVFNSADIDNSEIVWARTMTPEKDAELMRYFRSRNIWRLDADAKPARLTRLSQAK